MLHITDSITSRQNQKIKNLISLQKQSERHKQQLFIIEGNREIRKAVDSGYMFEAVFFYSGLIGREQIEALFGRSLPEQIYEVNDHVYSKIAYREGSEGIVVTARPETHDLQTVSKQLSSNPLLLVIEGIEKPGNIGAIYRTADAAGIDGILICNPKTDLYNPNLIRASLGCVFTVPTAIVKSPEAITWLQDKGISIFTTYITEKSVAYHTINYNQPAAIVVGAEATGISNAWLNASDANLIIPMKGMADSLNVSSSAAILVFEACRQRDFLSAGK